MGPLARLIAYTLGNVNDTSLLQQISQDLLTLTSTLDRLWRHIKLSEVHISEESIYLDKTTIERTIPQLWRMLRSILFSVTVVLRAVLDRVINDSSLATSNVATQLALDSLYMLRHLFFISTRLGSNTFSQYSFVYLIAIDILSAHPLQADKFIHGISPATFASVSNNPLDRILDLFFLNAAEHLVFVLPASTTEGMVLKVAATYLASGGNRGLRENFEAAHSVMLAVFASTQNLELSAAYLPQYIEALFEGKVAQCSAFQLANFMD